MAFAFGSLLVPVGLILGQHVSCIAPRLAATLMAYPTSPDNFLTRVCRKLQFLAAQQGRVTDIDGLPCEAGPNSALFYNQVLFDSTGLPIGIIMGAWVRPNLRPFRLAFRPLGNGVPARCLLMLAQPVAVGRNGIEMLTTLDLSSDSDLMACVRN